VIFSSFSLILSRVFSTLVAPLVESIVKLLLLLFKSDILSSRADALASKAKAFADALDFSSKQTLSFRVAASSKSFVSLCFCSSDKNSFKFFIFVYEILKYYRFYLIMFNFINIIFISFF